MGVEGILDYVGLGGLYRAYTKTEAAKKAEPQKQVSEAAYYNVEGQVCEEPQQTLAAKKDPPVTHLPKPKIVAVAAGGGSGSENALASVIIGGLHGISSILPVACGSDVPTISDFCDVPIFDPDGAINESLQTTVNASLLDNKFSFSAEMRITTEGQINDALIDGQLRVSVFSLPGLIGADQDGVLKIRQQKSEVSYEACTEGVRNCTPFTNFPGLMPVGTPQVDANGGYMLEAVDGKAFASLGEMRERTFGRPVKKFDFDKEPINIAQIITTDWDSGDQTPSWFRVSDKGIIINPDGSPIGQEDSVPSEELVLSQGIPIEGQYAPADSQVSSLPAVMTYFRTNGDAVNPEYFDVDQDTGYLVPDPDLRNTSFKVRIDTRKREDYPTDQNLITFEEMYMGRYELDDQGNVIRTILPGLAINDEGIVDFDLLSKVQLKGEYSLTFIDQRVGYDSAPDSHEAIPVDREVDSLTIPVPRQFYSDGTIDMLVKVNFNISRDFYDGIHPAYIYSAKFGAKASVYNPDEQDCQ